MDGFTEQVPGKNLRIRADDGQTMRLRTARYITHALGYEYEYEYDR